jgi:SAM-dependent methyltransferase
MNTMPTTSISEQPSSIRAQNTATAPNTASPCPICGKVGARPRLAAPDRFHGRKEKYTLLRCAGCSLVWLDNPPKPEEMHLHYTEAYDRLISASGEDSPVRWRHRNAALAPYMQSGALLDLGCSSGAFLQSLDSKKWSLYGIEMSAESAKKAEEKTGAQIFVGNILDAQFPPESFDVITCFDVLEHLYEPTKIMAKVAEWLKPGGIFYVLIPNIDSAEGRVFGSYWHGLELPRHLFHYCPASLKFLAESVGLKAVSIETRRNPAVGVSLRYVWDDVFSAFGIHRTSVAYRTDGGLVWRAARKAVRVTVLRALLAIAPLFGGGESIHAIFQKDSVGSRAGS